MYNVKPSSPDLIWAVLSVSLQLCRPQRWSPRPPPSLVQSGFPSPPLSPPAPPLGLEGHRNTISIHNINNNKKSYLGDAFQNPQGQCTTQQLWHLQSSPNYFKTVKSTVLDAKIKVVLVQCFVWPLSCQLTFRRGLSFMSSPFTSDPLRCGRQGLVMSVSYRKDRTCLSSNLSVLCYIQKWTSWPKQKRENVPNSQWLKCPFCWLCDLSSQLQEKKWRGFREKDKVIFSLWNRTGGNLPAFTRKMESFNTNIYHFKCPGSSIIHHKKKPARPNAAVLNFPFSMWPQEQTIILRQELASSNSDSLSTG